MITLDDVLLDPEDRWILSAASWHITKDGYVGGRINGEYVLLHYVVIEPAPDGWVTDHRNQIKHDCRKDNLRYASYTGNRLNQARTESDCIREVASGRYNVRVRLSNHRVNVGTFDTYEQAVSARDAYRSSLDVERHYQSHNGRQSRKVELLQAQRL